MKTLGLNDEKTGQVIAALKANLADLHVLYVKTRNAHWNLIDPRFQPLHTVFEEQYTALGEAIDEVAERIRMLGGVAPGSMREFLDTARLQEMPGGEVGGDAALAFLLSDHEAVVRQLREDIAFIDDEAGDAGTADFLTGLIRDHEKTAWMIRSFIRAGEV